MNQPRGKEFLSLAGPGGQDFTRIAASDPKMWRDVLLANRHELVEQAQMFQRSLHNMLQLAEDGNGEKLEGKCSTRRARPARTGAWARRPGRPCSTPPTWTSPIEEVAAVALPGSEHFQPRAAARRAVQRDYRVHDLLDSDDTRA